MSPKGRGSNKSRSQPARHRGTQAGTLARRRVQASPLIRAGLLTDEERRSGVLDETATFFDRMRAKIRKQRR